MAYIYICIVLLHIKVWPSSKMLGFQADRPSLSLLWLSFLFKSCGLWMLSCDFAHTINETLKWLTPMSILV